MRFSLNDYLNYIRLPNRGKLLVSVETLYKLVEHQVAHIPYQNVDLFLMRQQPLPQREGIILEPSQFFTKYILNNRGGYCHQLNALLAMVLTKIGFQVEQVPVIIADQGVFDPYKLSTHHVLIVIVDNQHFLVDVGFGYNSTRYPLAFDIAKEGIYEARLDYGIYRLHVYQDHFAVDMILNQNIFPFYRFARPYQVLNKLDLEALNLKMIMYPEPLIHDRLIRLGLLTVKYRLGIHAELFADHTSCQLMQWDIKGNKKISEFAKEDFTSIAMKKFNVSLKNASSLLSFLK